MYARSMFLNQAVCATMIAAAVAPMTSVSTMTRTCSRRRIILISNPESPIPSSERLANTEMHPPPPRLQRAVDQQTRNRIELVAHVEANGADRRLVPQSRTDVVPQIAQLDPPRIGPDVAGVEEHDAAKVAAKHRAQLRGEGEEAV